METNSKLREALLQVIRSMELESGHMCTEKKRLGMHGQTQEDLCKGCRARNAECWTMTLKRECEAALAEPVKNCEVGTAQEQYKRHCAYCNKTKDFSCAPVMCRKCRKCYADWAQMPYVEQEGGSGAD